ncbi:MAG TPA: hypothetical protein PLI95_04960, partial [Polyangiaceae bacterium]|nr:hypothetical protein [Polyangiaceae bacterium]
MSRSFLADRESAIWSTGSRQKEIIDLPWWPPPQAERRFLNADAAPLIPNRIVVNNPKPGPPAQILLCAHKGQELAAMTDTAPIIPMPTAPAEGEPLVVRRRPGRPKKIRPAPTADQAEYERAVAEARERAIEGDAVRVLLQSGNADTAEVLWAIVEGLACESAALRWNREHAESGGADAQRISTRRIDALGRIADLVCAGRKAGLLQTDYRSPQVSKVADLWLATISEAANETLPVDVAQGVVG